MTTEIEICIEMIEKGLRLILGLNTAFVISKQEEADADNVEDHMRSYAFLNGKHVELCIKANSKKGCVDVYNTKEGQVKTLYGSVEILRWDLVSSKKR